MFLESSLPLVATCLLGAAAAFLIWLRVQAHWLLAAATLLTVAGTGCFIADWLVETDREHLLAMFPRLANAAEHHDVKTIMAALDTDLEPLREQADRVLSQVRPTEVVVTKCDVVVEPTKKPPEAVATLIVRVTGNVIDKGTPGTVLVGMKILLHKKHGTWLVQDAEAAQGRYQADMSR